MNPLSTSDQHRMHILTQLWMPVHVDWDVVYHSLGECFRADTRAIDRNSCTTTSRNSSSTSVNCRRLLVFVSTISHPSCGSCPKLFHGKYRTQQSDGLPLRGSVGGICAFEQEESMSWRNLAYGSQAAAEAAPTVAPTKLAPVKEVVPQVDASSVPKNDGAKVYKILEYLRKIPMHQPVSVKDVFQHTGIDLTMDEQVDQRLKNNPKVRVDGEMYAYQAKYDIKNRMQLLKILERMPEGMPIEDFIDCYVGVENDLNELSRTGEIICLKNAENGAEVFYPRGMQFLVDVSGVATVEPGCYYAHSTVDISGEVRRGDAIRVGDQWFRASAAVKTNSSARPAAFAGMASKSVSSTRDPNVSKKIRYLLKFDKDHIPLDAPFPDAKRREIVTDRWDSLPQRGPKFQMIKHGCTNDIRQLWRDTLRHWPTDRAEFEKKLVQAGLTTQAKVDANRRQIKRRLKEDKRKPRMRKQREIKISNDHLIGTELGEILAKGGDDGFTLGAVKFEKS